ncbi:MAG: MFS transporter [Dehalococcoidia bacterium]|nr:MFS transporter [Dehalococcoidia bacterium]
MRRALGPLLEHEQLLMISISTVLVMAGQGVIAPVLPLFAEEFGVGAAAIGLTLSFFALARLILNVPLGVLSDRYGRRMLLITGPLVTGIGMVGSGMSGSIEVLLAWRFVAGAGSAMYMTGAQIYLTDISTPENRARFIGTNQGALLFGTSLGPAVGGLLAEVWGIRMPFYVVGAAALVATVYAYLRLPETRHLAQTAPPPRAPVDGEKQRRPWVQFLLSRDFFAVSWVTLMVFFTRTASRQTIMPLMAVASFGMGAGSLGVLFTVMSVVNLVLIPPAAMIADRFGRKAAIVPSGLTVAVGLAIMAVSPNLTVFVGGAMVLALGTSIAGPAPAAYAADIAPPHLRGLAMGLYRSSGDIGFLIGPIILGLVADASTYSWALWLNTVLIAAASLFFLTARETVQRTGARPVPVRG